MSAAEDLFGAHDVLPLSSQNLWRSLTAQPLHKRQIFVDPDQNDGAILSRVLKALQEVCTWMQP
jgi:hypothetical protein